MTKKPIKIPVQEIDVVKELTKHPGGRPSEYEPSFVQQVYVYLGSYDVNGEVLPTIEGLAVQMGVGKPAIYRWESQHEEFRNALDDLRAKQGMLLQNNGLIGKFAPVITKLMLSANHGMAEKSEQKQEQSGIVEVRIRKD